MENLEYKVQRALKARLAKGELSRQDLLERGTALLAEEVARLRPRPVAAA